MVSRAVPLFGLMLLAVGLVWFFHGVGLLQDGVMTGDRGSAVVGAVMVAGGIALLGRARATRG